MKRTTVFLAGAGVGITGFLLWKILSNRARPPLHLTSADLGYQDLSDEELNEEHLIDLNHAEPTQLAGLKLKPEVVERVIENRPYRSKLDLLSRMVLSEAEYEAIKNKVGIAHGREPVKIG
jgi:hypothetical protein